MKITLRQDEKTAGGIYLITNLKAEQEWLLIMLTREI